LHKRFYILFVARDADGQIRKVEIPLYYFYVIIFGGLIGLLSMTGIAGSYVRMLAKVSHVNELRREREALKTQVKKLEQSDREKDIQVASLGALASEVSALYGLKPEPILTDNAAGSYKEEQVHTSMDQLSALKASALSGAATVGIGMGLRHTVTLADWVRASSMPNAWPVEGQVTGGFGERADPFNGEGSFHRGIDIACSYGEPVEAPADGIVTFADFMNGYGRAVIVEHHAGLSTLYAHMSGFSVTAGQYIHRGDVIGYVGLSGRSTGPHLHYEVRINNVPVNPYKYLRTTLARHSSGYSAGS
jgi:murein DD-endopeptidase MepM/ murein hydrolase activator NlpD